LLGTKLLPFCQIFVRLGGEIRQRKGLEPRVNPWAEELQWIHTDCREELEWEPVLGVQAKNKSVFGVKDTSDSCFSKEYR